MDEQDARRAREPRAALAPDDGPVPLTVPVFGREELEEIAAVLEDRWVATGPRVARFETALRAAVRTQHLVALNSCSAGLLLALALLEIGHGDDVLVPAMTYVACPNVVHQRGARTVLVDSDRETGLVDLAHARSLVTPRTKALIAVHLHGRPLDLDALEAFTSQTGVPVVEDAAHAIGARWQGEPVGSRGLVSFSFHASKTMTTFDGGALVVRSAAEAERAGRLSRQGMTRASWERHDAPTPGVYDVAEPGYKLTMHDVAAAVGLCQLRRVEGWIEHRALLAARYDDALAGHDRVAPLPPVPHHARHAQYAYAVRVLDGTEARDALARSLSERRIGSTIHFRALHLHTWFREGLGVRPEDVPNADALSGELLSLPLHASMDEHDVDRVVGAVDELLR